MPIVRCTPDDLDMEKLLADLRAARPRTEAEIDAEAAEDGDASTPEDLAREKWVYPAPSPADLRDRLGPSQAVFAHRVGFSIDAIRRYEQGSGIPSGSAAVLLRVIAADRDAVTRALWGAPTPTPGA